MSREIAKAHNPKEVERWYGYWLDRGHFHALVDSGKKPSCVVIPPPNVTGSLHVGHALNSTLQDVLVRRKRMEGYESLWLPGVDHAGIATQLAVEREIGREGLSRYDLGREAFLKRVWQWKEMYGGDIIEKLKKLGCSCDWERQRFTLDEGYSLAVREAFVRYYERGLVYRGEYIINWCPRCRTAISDLEVEHEEVPSKLYYLRYPFKDAKGHVVVATTRPETMLGDTAVAVSPGDKRYKPFVGKVLLLPLAEREIPIIEDELVDPEFGTGAVKVTPAHDPNDFEIRRRHGLESVQVIGEDGRMTEEAGSRYRGLSREECRESVLSHLRERELLEKVDDYHHSVGKCARCHTVVEPLVSEQWFVKMKPLAEPAIRVVEEGKVRFVPERWTKIYLNWLENIRDWCISRQLWWGHRIPVWYCEECSHLMVSREEPSKCDRCKSSRLLQDENVLDTWFSSALWPFATLGWPEETPELKAFYPTSVLVTDSDIICLWVARMVMSGLEFMGEIPFRDVYIHSTVLNAQGRRMSRSLGTGVDPTDLMERYGTDALRFTLTSLETQSQSFRLSEDRCEYGRNFANKVWNVSRFILMNLEKAKRPSLDFLQLRSGHVARDKGAKSSGELEFCDRWILSRYNRTVSSVTQALDDYSFNEAAKNLYEFTWHEFCDWYVELTKPRLYGDDGGAKTTVLAVTTQVLLGILRLLHPFMPFVTEELWQKFPGEEESIVVAEWPKADSGLLDEETEAEMSLIQKLIVAIRNMRSEMGVPPQKMSRCYLSCGDGAIRRVLKETEGYFSNLAKVEELTVGDALDKPPKSATAVVSGVDIYLPLEDLIDFDVERRRLSREVDRVSQELKKVENRLKAKEFLGKAPEEIVLRTKAKRDEYAGKLEKLRQNLKVLEEKS